MKKNVLALSITAALVGFGFAGGAQAIGLASGTAPTSGTAITLAASSDGIGQFLYVPYYSAQSGNNTMINLVNTDTTNGKAVKVRFRGAANSDDFFDFQVFLSPNDVWNASISQGADGIAKLYTADNSCTKPARGAATGTAILGTLNGTPFRTDRLFTGGNTAWKANQTREGYVEIFNMADIPPTVRGQGSTAGEDNVLFADILHANGQPDAFSTSAASPSFGGGCASDAFTKLDTDPSNVAAAYGYGLAEPTTGLFSNWIILNANDAGAWSGASPALVAMDAGEPAAITAGALVYFPQMNNALDTTAQNALNLFTADKWLIVHANEYASYFDLPDFSTPYTGTDTPAVQVAKLSATLATTHLYNEFLTVSGINATTDWVLTMPTRRYYTQYDYAKKLTSTQTNADRQLFGNGAGGYFTSDNTKVVENQICVKGVSSKSYDQEEATPEGNTPGPIISPRNPDAPTDFLVCGEASVLSFNNGEPETPSGSLVTAASGSLMATVARSTIENGYAAGWTRVGTPGNGNGLPIVGYAAYRAVNAVGTFGATLPHRTDLVNK